MKRYIKTFEELELDDIFGGAEEYLSEPTIEETDKRIDAIVTVWINVKNYHRTVKDPILQNFKDLAGHFHSDWEIGGDSSVGINPASAADYWDESKQDLLSSIQEVEAAYPGGRRALEAEADRINIQFDKDMKEYDSAFESENLDDIFGKGSGEYTMSEAERLLVFIKSKLAEGIEINIQDINFTTITDEAYESTYSFLEVDPPYEVSKLKECISDMMSVYSQTNNRDLKITFDLLKKCFDRWDDILQLYLQFSITDKHYVDPLCYSIAEQDGLYATSTIQEAVNYFTHDWNNNEIKGNISRSMDVVYLVARHTLAVFAIHLAYFMYEMENS